MSNRKLIRPNLQEIKEKLPARAPRRKAVPPETTNAESFYYLKQMNARTPMVVCLQDGERLHGVIEWYDKDCLKINRTKEPNVLVLKRYIKYMYKESDARGRGQA